MLLVDFVSHSCDSRVSEIRIVTVSSPHKPLGYLFCLGTIDVSPVMLVHVTNQRPIYSHIGFQYNVPYKWESQVRGSSE